MQSNHELSVDANTAADDNLEIAFDQLVTTLESLPADLQELPANDPRVAAYIDQAMREQAAEALQSNQDKIKSRSWIGLAKCTAHLAEFVVTTGVPVGKFLKALKEFKAIAGSWKAMAKLWRAGDWGALGGESIEILKKLSGIDGVISACAQAF